MVKTKSRRSSIRKIESLAARNVCFTKRRKGLFKKAEELCRLYPVHGVVFSPAGTPYVFGDPSSLPNPNDDIDALLSLDISTLSLSDLETYAERLRQHRSILASNTVDNPDPHPHVGISEPGVNSKPSIIESTVLIEHSMEHDLYSNIDDWDFLNNSDFDLEFPNDNFASPLLGSQSVDDDAFLHLPALGVDCVLETDFESHIDTFPHCEFGSQFTDDALLSLTDFGVDSEFEILKSGFEFVEKN